MLSPSLARHAVRNAIRPSTARGVAGVLPPFQKAQTAQTAQTAPLAISSAFSTSTAAAAAARPQPLFPSSRPALLQASSLCRRPASKILQQQQQQQQQRRHISDTTRQAIDRAVASAPVVLFMKGTPELPQCGFSRAAIQILGLQGVDPDKFAAFNVLEDAELRAGIKEYSDWPTIPQLYVGGEFVGGCDILVAMHQSGELAKLFDDNKVLIAAGESGEGEEGAKQKA